MTEDEQSSKDQLLIAAIINDPSNQRPKPQQSNSPVSEHLPDYLRILGHKDLEQCRSHKSQLLASLSSSQSFHGDADRGLRITVVEASRDCEYALLEVRYNRFEFYVWLLNVDEESPSHRIQKSHCGNFSTVYHTKHGGKDMAIKCTAFRNKAFQKVFRDTLLEYLVFQMADRLKCGPAMPRLFAFDLLVFRNCIEFSMEFCSHRLQPGPALAADLTAALRSLHGINVIHFDIKPENICFSEEAGKAVFIDFGLHAVVREEVGQISMTKFNGSLLMCSEEMKKIFMEGTGVADLYYNDAVCLMESLNQISSSDTGFSIIKKDAKSIQESQIHILIKLKYLLAKINSQQVEKAEQKQYLLNFLRKLGNNSFHSLLKFIENLSYSVVLEATIEEIQKLYPQINAQNLIAAKLKKELNLQVQEQQGQLSEFNMRIKLIKRLNSYNPVEDQTLHIDKELVTLLADEDKARKLSQKVYYRLFSQIQQINCWKVNERIKEELAVSFNRVWLHAQQFEKMVFEEKQSKCFHYIDQYVARQPALDRSLFLIVKYSLLSTMLLQIYTPPQFEMYLSKIMSLSCPIATKIRLFLHILSCLQWLLVCVSTYSYYYLVDFVYGLISKFLLTLSSQPDQNTQQIIDIIRTLLSPSCKSKDKIMHKLVYLQTKLNNKIIKFYTAVRQEEQLVAQLYVYILCYLMQLPEKIIDSSYNFFAKLLTLQSYRKEAKLCIFDYYQFQIALLLIVDSRYKSIFKKKYLNKSWGKKYAYNYLYSSEMNNGQIGYLKGNVLYFHQKDLGKINKVHALQYRIGILMYFQQLQAKLSTTDQLIDSSSAAQTFSLTEVNNFLPELQGLASYNYYHSYEIFYFFKLCYMYITDYFTYREFGLLMDKYDEILYRLKEFANNIDCIYCKFSCLEFFFFYDCRKNQQSQNQQFFQQLWHLLLWRMKQSSLDMKITAQMILVLCFHSIKTKQYINLLIQYVINNSISATFFYRNWIFVKENIILSSLWNRRYLQDQAGQTLYFRLIRYLFNYFQHSKFKNSYYVEYFVKFIELFIEVVDYQEFFLFNSNYLFQNRQILKDQKYSAMYFSMILVSPFRQLQQQVRPFYYAFICQLCPQLSLICKIITQRCLYRSFICNQIKKGRMSLRKAYYFMKLEFKSHQCESFYSQDNLSLLRMLKGKLQTFRKKANRQNPSKIYYQKIRLKIYEYFKIYAFDD